MPRRLLSAVTLIAALVCSAGASISQATPSPECAAVNARTKLRYFDLQDAVNAAAPGDTLKLSGTCYGDSTVDFNLTIAGAPSATLNGANSSSAPGTVVTVGGGASVAINHVTVSGGYASGELHEAGGGIYVVNSSLTLTGATVSANVSASSGLFEAPGAFGGGGIYNEGGSLTLNRTKVTANTGLGFGGGIYNSGRLALTGSTVSANLVTYSNRGELEATAGGGIFSSAQGQATLDESVVTQNRSGEGFGCNSAGGIYAGGTLTLTSSRVTNNTAEGECGAGGGIVNSGALTLDGSTVSGNSASPGGRGGGILASSRATSTTLSGKSLLARNLARDGAGIYNESVLTLSGAASVTRNRATELGGGIFDEEEASIVAREWSGSLSGNIPENVFTR